MRRLLTAFSFAAVLGLMACGTTELPPNVLSDTSWTLVALVQDGDSLTTVPPDRLAFQADSGVRLQSCNNCVGLYAFDDDGLTIEQLGCTRRACPTGRIELSRYLQGRNGYVRTGDQLMIRVNDTLNGIDARLYFQRMAPSGDETQDGVDTGG